MRIVQYRDRNPRDPRIAEATGAIRRYFEASDHDYRFVENDEPVADDADVAIVWGSFDPESPPAVKNTARRREIKAAQERGGGALIVVEVGFIHRHAYYSVGLNDLTGFGCYSLTARTDGPRHPVPRPRPLRAARADSPVLLAGQIPHDTQIRLGGAEKYVRWLEDAARQIRRASPRRIVFKPHPKLAEKHALNGEAWSRRNGVALDRGFDVSEAWAVVAYNSNVLLEALIAGVPCFCCSSGSVVHDLCNRDLGDIERPAFPSDQQRTEALNRLTWCQWTAGELEAGLPFEIALGKLLRK